MTSSLMVISVCYHVSICWYTFAVWLLSHILDLANSENIHTYGDVPGLPPSPYYSFRLREVGCEDWMDTFALVTECTAEKYCNTTGFYDHIGEWSNTYINFEMKDNVQVEIEVTKLWGNHITKAVVHPYPTAESIYVTSGKAVVKINKPGLFTVDINGQMDDQDTGKTPAGPFYWTTHSYTHNIFQSLFGR